MKQWVHKVEVIIDKLIPYSLVILFFVIIMEIFFSDVIEPYRLYVSIIDGFIIGLFIVDLMFKYDRAKDIEKFFRTYWLQIIALFPAFIFVRLVEEFIIILSLEESIAISQELIEVGEKSIPRTARARYFGRFIRPLARLPRFLKAFSFYEKPTGMHHSF